MPDDTQNSKKKIYKPKAITGYREWLPEVRLVELKWLDHIRAVFESYGFCNIETPSVEEIDVLLAKGEVDKEIYVIERLHKDEDSEKESRLALHFDQTVPFARYTAQHFNELVFPFKRYQMQRVWRGERPQRGRLREFVQCDIDVINVDNLPLSFDAEIPAIAYEALSGLNIGRVQMRISNRKILLGLLEDLKIEDGISITRIIDKIEKMPREEIVKLLKEEKLSSDHINAILYLAETKGGPENVRAIEARNDTMREGIEELATVMEQLAHLPQNAVIADLSIVRGLDYYTGTVYETQLLDVEGFSGSVCSGGRYDDLAGGFINKHLPGVGISIGFSRLFDVMQELYPERLEIGPKSPAQILVALPSEDRRTVAADTARTLRERGLSVELYHAAQKIQKQLSYAEKKGIPFVWFPPFEDGKPHEVKKLSTREQAEADPQNWMPE
jgi:histidyl-tRNA synthetase